LLRNMRVMAFCQETTARGSKVVLRRSVRSMTV
jgi:hypothetical protein